MIDNPLPDQVMQEKETLQNAQDFELTDNQQSVFEKIQSQFKFKKND